MRQEQPGLQGGKSDELPPEMLHSGSLGSPLEKTQQKDTRVPKGKEWARELVREIPDDQLEIVAAFIRTFPPDQTERVGKELFDRIRSMANGILRSPDPKRALEECLEQVRNRLEN